MLALQQVKPKNARAKRELAKREPQIEENTKKTLFLRYTNSSSLLNSLLSDLHNLKRPFALKFTKKNSIHPFEDASSLEFFSQKNDASQMVFASHSKKRPHALTWVRCFDGQVLDMMELLVVQDTARCMQQFKGAKCRIGLKPMLTFSGTAWDDPERSEYGLAKNLFMDFFRGGEVSELDVEGLQLLITFAAGEAIDSETKPPIHMRCWRIRSRRNGTSKTPQIDVDEIGPRIDFRMGRVRMSDTARMKEALKKARGTQPKSRKNVETDLVGDKMGKIHLGKQDLANLQTRKMKGLKRSRDQLELSNDIMADDDNDDIMSDDDEVFDDDDDDDDDDDEGSDDVKRARTS